MRLKTAAENQRPRVTVMFVTAALLVIAGVCQLIPRSTSPLSNGEVRRLVISNSNLELPRDAVINALDGRRPLVLGRTPIEGGDLVTVEHLEPGTYTISWPGNGYGGNNFPARASIVIVEAIDAAHAGSAFDPRNLFVGAFFALMLVLALLAGRAARGSRQRAISGGLLVMLLCIWGGSGWHSPDVQALIALLLVASAFVCVLTNEAYPYGGYTLVAGISILLWPTALVGGLATLLVVGMTLVYAMRHSAREITNTTLRSLLTGATLVLVLTAGVWAGHAGDVGSGSIRLDMIRDDGLDFADCAERTRSESTLGRECFSALGARLGANLPAQEASQALFDGLASVGIRKDSQCRTAGVALSYGASRWGAGRDDPRALFVELAPICDYSSMHGIVAGAFAHSSPARFAADVLLLCAPRSPDETRLNSPEYSRQCWQSAGIAIGRRTRYADPAALLFCEQAAPYGINNCTDGYFQELVDQKARAVSEPGSQLYPEEVSVLTLCSGLPGRLAGGCYRYVGEEVYYEGGTRQEGLLELERVCAEEVTDEHSTSCWYALGMVSVRTLQQGSFTDLAAPVNEICPNAPTEQTLLQCLHGGGNAVIGLLGKEAPIEAICAWFPDTRREEYCEYTARYRDHLREGDPAN
jgi:hypothetical protein